MAIVWAKELDEVRVSPLCSELTSTTSRTFVYGLLFVRDARPPVKNTVNRSLCLRFILFPWTLAVSEIKVRNIYHCSVYIAER